MSISNLLQPNDYQLNCGQLTSAGYIYTTNLDAAGQIVALGNISTTANIVAVGTISGSNVSVNPLSYISAYVVGNSAATAVSGSYVTANYNVAWVGNNTSDWNVNPTTGALTYTGAPARVFSITFSGFGYASTIPNNLGIELAVNAVGQVNTQTLNAITIAGSLGSVNFSGNVILTLTTGSIINLRCNLNQTAGNAFIVDANICMNALN